MPELFNNNDSENLDDDDVARVDDVDDEDDEDGGTICGADDSVSVVVGALNVFNMSCDALDLNADKSNSSSFARSLLSSS